MEVSCDAQQEVLVTSATQPIDGIEARRRQWARELPDLDTTGMAILGRMRWLTLAARPRIEAVFAGYDLDAGEFDVLGTLLRAGAPYQLRPTELFRSLMISSGGLTDRLARLAVAGLVARTPSPQDARSLLVQLTDEGRRRATAAFREDMAVERDLLAGLTDRDRDTLSDLLAKLALQFEAADSSRQAEMG
jgi:DNA-binding MarR family transcriptional regulator